MRISLFRGSAAAFALFVSTSALAVTGSASAGLQALRETNLIVLGNMAGGSEAEGKAFIGGNLTGNTTNFGVGNSAQSAATSLRPTLTVGGNAISVNINSGPNGSPGGLGATIGGTSNGIGDNAANATFLIGGNIAGNVNGTTGSAISYGGTVTGGNVNANGATVTRDTSLAAGGSKDVAANVAAQKTQLDADLKALSAALGNLTIVNNPSTISFSGGMDKPIFNAVAGSNGYALFTLTAAQYNGFSQIDFNFPSTSLPIIINVSGTSITDNANTVGGNTSLANQQVIWNFYQATTLSVQRTIHGSVLAPFATLSNNTALEGSVAVQTFNSGGEVHLGTYNLGSPFLSAGAVPEPATWALLLAGFGMVGMAMRRRTTIVLA